MFRPSAGPEHARTTNRAVFLSPRYHHTRNRTREQEVLWIISSASFPAGGKSRTGHSSTTHPKKKGGDWPDQGVRPHRDHLPPGERQRKE